MAKKKNTTEGIPSYLNDEIGKLSEAKLLEQTKLRSAQYAFAENVKKNIGPNIKKEMNPTTWDKVKRTLTTFWNKITNKYGNY